MQFKTKIRDYIGSTSASAGYTTDTISDDRASRFVVDGCYDVYNKIKAIKGSDATQKFGIWSDPAITNGNAIDIDEVHEIVFVQRNGIPATEVSPNLLDRYTSADSIHYASANDPIFYFQEQYMTIKPAPAGGAEAYYIYLPEYSLTNYASGTSSIDKFPAEYYDNVLIYASIKCLEDLMHNYIEDEEDSELAQLIGQRIDRLKVQYNEMFGVQQQ